MRIRIGNDITIRWDIYRYNDGLTSENTTGSIAEDLTNAINLTVKLGIYGKGIVSTLTEVIVDVNLLTVHVPKELTPQVGKYYVILDYDKTNIELDDKLQHYRLDSYAFDLVSYTASADDVTDIAIESQLVAGIDGINGLSAYELAVHYEGFTGTVEEYLASLRQPAIESKEEVDVALVGYEELKNELDNGEEARIYNEQLRVLSETARTSAETARVSNETDRVAAETVRVASEEVRESAEASRVDAESARSTAEDNRTTAEASRVTAETARVSSESQRVINETARGANEASRVDAETSRAASEDDRISAESARGINETSRVDAETARAGAEATRANNEADRVASETDRVAAEQARVAFFDTVSGGITELRSDLNEKLNLYNVTTQHPLSAGEYYTISTAASAVELSLRKTGLIITFEVEAGVWQQWQYTSSDTSSNNWKLGINWKNISKRYTNGVGGGTSEMQTATFKGNAQLEAGCTYIFTPSVSNITVNPRVNINSLAPVVVKLGANTAMGDTLIAGDIKAGIPCELYYNGVNLLLMNPQAQINNALSVIKTQSNQGNFYGLINLANTFPYYAIKSISLIGCNDISALYTSGVPKDLYLVYLRKRNVSNATTIIQIGEKIGASVGVGVNTFATFSDSNEVGTINNYILTGNNGIRVSLTIDWSLVGESAYTMNIQVPINIHKFIGEAESFLNAKKRDFWKNPTNTVFNYSAIMRIEAVKGSRSLLYKSDGTLKELYLTYMRLNMNQGITNIIQIAWKDDATVGMNDKIFATTIDDFRDMSAKPITEFTLKGAGEFAGLEFSMIVDLSLVPTSILSNATLSNSLQLNTILFAEQLRAAESGQNFQNKQIVCFGDSVTEFGNYPKQIADITGAMTYKIGFGGCHLAQRSDSVDYNQLGMVKIAESIASGDYTAMQTAVANLAALPYPLTDDNTPAFNRLTSIDFSKVDFVTIFFGTNDFTGNKVIGDSGSTDTFEITGAVNYIVNTLLTAYPQIKILFITPTHRFFNTSDDSDLVANTIGKYLVEYCDAIEMEAGKNHLPCLNMYREGGLNKYNHAYYFDTNNVHPNATGYTYLAQKISAALNSLFKF